MSPLTRRAPAVALLVLGTVYLALMLPVVRAPFGDSHDGRNAGVWADGSRALREDGPVASVFGARHRDGTVYTNHPPAILSATALAETLGGERPPATRAPELLASLSVIPLLYLLLRALDLGRLAAVLGTTAAVTTPMFRTFGAMVDTPILGLPVGLAVLLVWARRRRGDPLPRALEAAIGVGSALVAWQCVFTVGVVVLATLLTRRGGGLRSIAPLAAGTAVGLALTLTWIAAGHDGLGSLGDVFVARVGAGERQGLAGAVDAQRSWLPDLLGPALLGVLGAVVALGDRRRRAPAAVVLAASVGWGVVMSDGAAAHTYWLFWAIVPAGFGVAWAVDALRTVRLPTLSVLRPAGIVALAVVAVAGLASTSFVQRAERAGASAGGLVRDAEFPSGQDALPLVGVVSAPSSWIDYQADLRGVPLTTVDELRRLADTDPDELVLVTTWCQDGPTGDACRAVVAPEPGWTRDYELVPATDLAARLRT